MQGAETTQELLSTVQGQNLCDDDAASRRWMIEHCIVGIVVALVRCTSHERLAISVEVTHQHVNAQAQNT